MTTAETLKFVLLAFAAGVILPLAVQVFLTLRSLNRNVERTSRRLNETIDALELAAQRAQQSASPATRSLTSLAAALIPAIVTAVRVYRGEGVAPAETAEQDGGVDPGEPAPAAENGSVASSHDARQAHA